jgi:hypothetical protein
LICYLTIESIFAASILPLSIGLIVVLDPLLLGCVPESLVPVIGYVFAVALFAWFVVGKVAVVLIKMASKSSPPGGIVGVHGSRQKLE